MKVKEKLVEIEFLGVVKEDGRKIKSFTELGHKYGIGTKISVPVHRAESLIKTYPKGFRYTEGSSGAQTSKR